MSREVLRGIVTEVAAQEGFEIFDYPYEDEGYYSELNPENADDCVDDRPPKDDEVPYAGMQLAGATFAKVDAFRRVTGASEQRSREVILNLYNEKGYGIGGHIDDRHGEISDPSELAKRTKGCGKLRVLSEGKVEIYKNLGVTEEIADERINWARTNGTVVALTEVHGAIGAVANLIEGQTLETRRAFGDKKAMFNGDFAESARRSAELWEMVQEGEKQEFVENMTRAEVTDYLQTLRALNYDGPLWVRG